jgi:hypothetical protein
LRFERLCTRGLENSTAEVTHCRRKWTREENVRDVCDTRSSQVDQAVVYCGEWKSGKYHGNGMFFQFPAHSGHLGWIFVFLLSICDVYILYSRIFWGNFNNGIRHGLGVWLYVRRAWTRLFYVFWFSRIPGQFLRLWPQWIRRPDLSVYYAGEWSCNEPNGYGVLYEPEPGGCGMLSSVFFSAPSWLSLFYP